MTDKLSDRVRPGVEAAPWVVAAIKRLEGEVAGLKVGHGEAMGYVAHGSHTGVIFYNYMAELPNGTKLYASPPRVQYANKLIEDLVKCVDQLMPGVGHTCADIGLLNETLIAARRHLETEKGE